MYFKVGEIVCLASDATRKKRDEFEVIGVEKNNVDVKVVKGNDRKIGSKYHSISKGMFVKVNNLKEESQLI